MDSFFDQEGRVAHIFEQEVSVLIPGIFQGMNATVFAYGATGSGKTYTMQVVIELFEKHFFFKFNGALLYTHPSA